MGLFIICWIDLFYFVVGIVCVLLVFVLVFVMIVIGQDLLLCSQWQVSSFLQQVLVMVVVYFIDGDVKIVIGGVFSLGYWFQVDFGVISMLSGV